MKFKLEIELDPFEDDYRDLPEAIRELINLLRGEAGCWESSVIKDAKGEKVGRWQVL